MSAQFVQTCALFSQSHRIDSTYLPGTTAAGMWSWSEISVLYGSRPLRKKTKTKKEGWSSSSVWTVSGLSVPGTYFEKHFSQA